MTPAIEGVMLAISSSLAASIVAKVTVVDGAWPSLPPGWLAAAVRQCVMRCWPRRSA